MPDKTVLERASVKSDAVSMVRMRLIIEVKFWHMFASVREFHFLSLMKFIVNSENNMMLFFGITVFSHCSLRNFPCANSSL